VVLAQGDQNAARRFISESRRFAALSGNHEGWRFAALFEARVSGPDHNTENGVALLGELPSHHLIARIMALREAARSLLGRGVRDEGERLLNSALTDARHLGLAHEIDKLRQTASRYNVAILPSAGGKVPNGDAH
jgi:hypothetical protein